MDNAQHHNLHKLMGPIALAICYYMLAAFSLYVTKGSDGITTIWPSSGLLLAAVLLCPKKYVYRYLLAGAIASLAANVGAGGSLYMSAAFTLANITAALIGSLVLRALGNNNISFINAKQVMKFCFAALVASCWSGTIATLLWQADWNFFTSWVTTVAVGMLVVAPLVIITVKLVDSGAIRNVERQSIAEIFLLLAAVAIVTALVFAQSSYPLLFLPPIAVFWATYRLGPFGAASSVLVVEIIATILTSNQTGPVHFIDGGTKEQTLFLQFYILVLLGSALPVAALLKSREKLAKELNQINLWLKKAEAIANVGHWSFNLKKQSLFWSNEVFAIHGQDNVEPPTLAHAMNIYHPDDQPRLSKIMKSAIKNGADFEFEARIIRPDGEIRHVVSHGEVRTDGKGKTIEVFGTMQDITVHVEDTKKLLNAQKEAEKTAKKAQKMADTDMLTGLPNRRKIMKVLRQHVDAARASGNELSIAILDIDYFKTVNDQHGHAVGDKVIKGVAGNIATILRSTDIVGRLGGEEFIVVLKGVNSGNAMAVCERIRELVETESPYHSVCAGVTVSIGIASLCKGMSLEKLMLLADKAMYEAKEAGRNTLRQAA